MLLKECGRCKKLIVYGKTYCEECQPIVDAMREERLRNSRQESNRRYNQKRDPKYIRFYRSADWKTLSRKRLQDDGFRCVKCKAIASEVDHIKPIQTDEGWEHRLDYNNLQSLCLSCHNEKHNRFKARRMSANKSV